MKTKIITIMMTILINLSIIAQPPKRILNIENLELKPNPFSPYSQLGFEPEESGIQISFDVETPSTFIWVTARVYNVNGELVRAILELEPIYSSSRADFEDRVDVVFYWDGKTDSGRMAKNGRYLLHLSISDGENQSFRDEKLKTLVLIK